MEEIFNHIDNLSEVGVITAFVIYFIYTLIKEFFFKNTNKKILNKLDNQGEVIVELLNYLKIVSKKYTEEITKNQAELVINKFLSVVKLKVTEFTFDIIKSNNLADRREKTYNKLLNYVNVLYKVDKSNFQSFIYNHKSLSDSMNCEWIKEITDIIIDKIYDKDLTKDNKTKQIKISINLKFNDIQSCFYNNIQN